MVLVKFEVWSKADLERKIEYNVIRCTSGKEELWFVAPSSLNYNHETASDYLLSTQAAGIRPTPNASTTVEMKTFSEEEIKKTLLGWKNQSTTKLKNEKEGVYYTFGKGKGPILTSSELGGKKEKPITKIIPTPTTPPKIPTTEKTPPSAKEEEITTTPTTYWRHVSTGTGGRVEVYVDGAGQIPSCILTFSINPIKGTHAVYKGQDGTQFNFETIEPSGTKKLWGARFNITTGGIDWFYWNRDKGDWVATRQPGNVEVTSTFKVGWEEIKPPGGKFDNFMNNAPEWLRAKMAQKIRE